MALQDDSISGCSLEVCGQDWGGLGRSAEKGAIRMHMQDPSKCLGILCHSAWVKTNHKNEPLSFGEGYSPSAPCRQVTQGH